MQSKGSSSSSDEPSAKRIKVSSDDDTVADSESVVAVSSTKLDLDIAVICYLSEDNTHHNVRFLMCFKFFMPCFLFVQTIKLYLQFTVTLTLRLDRLVHRISSKEMQ